MACFPLTRRELDQLLAAGLSDADDAVHDAWDAIKIEPEKWQCPPWGDDGGGFWVVAIRTDNVIWFNDIEEGFNTSKFRKRGVIDDYRSDQTEFADVLNQLPEAVAAEAFARRSPVVSPPDRARGRGLIMRRQTNSWLVQPEAGDRVRVHFSGKREARFVAAEYDSLVLRDQHPVLQGFVEDWSSLYLSGGPNPRHATVVDQMKVAVEAATAGWRGLAAYVGDAHVREVIRLGYGLLMRAPVGVLRAVQEVVEAEGLSPSLVGSWRELGRGERPRVLVLGRSFVIADAFRFEPEF